jgi:glycosyltransferase involved in cell wall biosynthesis
VAKITLLGPSLAAVSGVSTHLLQLINSDLGAKFDLDHFQIGSEGRTEGFLGKALRMLISPFSLAWHLFEHRSSIVHINTSLEPNSYWRDVVYLLVAKALRRKVVYQIHGGALPEDFFRGRRLLTEVLRWVLGRPDFVVLLASCELSAYRSFAPRARFTVIANAVDTKGYLQERTARQIDEPLRIVYMGRLVETKGIVDVVEAARILKDRGVKFMLSIAGSGPLDRDLRKLVNKAHLEDRVSFVGPVFGSEKDLLWLRSDVFAFPTFHREGLPYAILEGMVAGAVPVTTPVGAIPDVLVDKVHGLYVSPHDPATVANAIQWLDDHREELDAMRLAGRRRIDECYTVRRLAEDFARLYERVLGISSEADPLLRGSTTL